MKQQADIERAVRSAALALLARDQTVAQVVAALAAAVDGVGEAEMTPRERAAAREQSRREQMLAELQRLEREGKGRGAVMIVAKKFASDPLDPVAVDSVARSLRRWRRSASAAMANGEPS